MSEPRTAKATEAVQQYSAERAAGNPAKLARAVRIVRAAIAAGRLAADDLLPTAGAR